MALSKPKGSSFSTAENPNKIVRTFQDDATPDVSQAWAIEVKFTALTSLTQLDNGYAGQIVFVRFGDGNCRIAFGTNFYLVNDTAMTRTFAADDVLICVRDETLNRWYCICSYKKAPAPPFGVGVTDTFGVVTHATAAQVTARASASTVVSPDSLAGSIFGIKSVTFTAFPADTTLVTTGATNGARFVVPQDLNGMNLIAVSCGVATADGAATTQCNIERIRAGSPVYMLSTVMTVDATEHTSFEAATPPVINAANDDVLTNDILRVEVTAATAAKGLTVTLTFQLPAMP